MIDSIIQGLAAQPPFLIYLIVGFGAAIENVFPPVPSDTFALFGAFLAAQGEAVPEVVFGVVWLGNVSTALMTYGLGRRYGRSVFKTRLGQWLLHPGQLAQVERFFGRWGTAAMFFSRFIPAVRAVAPVFAGVSRMGFWRMFLPLAVASALWYAVIVWVGTTAGNNWQAIREALEPYNTALAIAGAILFVAIGWWWWTSRRKHRAADATAGAGGLNAGEGAAPGEPRP